MNSADEALARFRPETAWKAYYPTAANPWDLAKVAHFWRRAGFGADWQTLQDSTNDTPARLVESLLHSGERGTVRSFEAEFDRLQAGVIGNGDALEARALLVHRLLHSPRPLLERMTLFWHNHFATSNAKVRDVRLMLAQMDTLRRHALGRFSDLLHEITRDPAMMIWLDAGTNRKGAPNENYAREIMELFSLGVGHYTERDVQEAARALTGWSVEKGKAVFDPAKHDAGEKTVFGQTGRWSAGDVVRLCLGHEACSRFLVRKLYRELISETATPSDALLEPLAAEFRARDYDFTWLVGTMLKSWVFFSPAAVGQKIKSPLDFLVGTARALEGRPSPTVIAQLSDQLGQSLLNPPSVKGWPGGTAWLNSATLLQRQNLALEMTRGMGPAARSDPARLISRQELSGPDQLAAFFLKLFHQRLEPGQFRSIAAQLEVERLGPALYADAAEIEIALARSAAYLALILPEYQLG